MARQARGELVNPDEVQIMHCFQRCVRHSYLCGHDVRSGKSFEHRREWIQSRMEFLASVFAIDILTFAVMNNHFHVVLRSRPDVVRIWSDREVARRWLRLFPLHKDEQRNPCEPSARELNSLERDKKAIGERRRRLSDVSWWMRCVAEEIARKANREDECTGRFWEGRFKAQVLLDEASVLACAAYVDLNPIRAAMAKSLEDSTFTGVWSRIKDLQERGGAPRRSTHAWERSDRRKLSGWLCPIEIDEHRDALDAAPSSGFRRPSQKGFLSLSLAAYLEFVDWTGRQLRGDKRGSIPSELAPILDRLNLEEGNWCELVRNYGRIFHRVAGTVENLAAEAERRGLQWVQAPGNPLTSAA